MEDVPRFALVCLALSLSYHLRMFPLLGGRSNGVHANLGTVEIC